MSGYPNNWRSNSLEPADRSGVGEVMVEGEKYVFAFTDFIHFHALLRALDAAFASGMEAGKLQARSLMERAIKDLGVFP